MGPIPSADHHTVDGVAYSVTAATECTVTSDTGLNMTIKAGAQGFLVGDGGTVHVEGSHYFTQCGGNFSPASTGGGGGGGDGRFDTDVVIGHGDGRATCLLHLGDPRAEGVISDNVEGHRNISCPPDNNRTCQDLVDLINDPTYSDFDVTAELLTDSVLVPDEFGTLNFYSAGIVKLTAKEPGAAANSIEFTTTYAELPGTEAPCFGKETVKLGSLNPGADAAAPTSLTLSINGGTVSGVDQVPMEGSSNLVTSGGVYDAIAGASGHLPDSYFAGWALQRTGKVYQTRLHKAVDSAADIVTGDKLLDNAGLVHMCYPDTDANGNTVDDYAGIHLFKWYNCNYIRKQNGEPRVSAIEGVHAGYQTMGAVDVGVCGPAFWWKVEEDGDYQVWTISDSPHPELGLEPWVECVRQDGTIAPYYCHSKYWSGTAVDGMLRSQPDLPVENFLSYNLTCDKYLAKGAGYFGGGACIHFFGILFDVIKNATKDSQSIHYGNTREEVGDNCYGRPSANTTGKSYVQVSATDAAKFDLYSTVSIGTTSDRNNQAVSSVVKMARIVEKQAVEGSTDIRLVLDYPAFNATTSNYVVSMPARSGETDLIPGTHDGSVVDVHNGRHAYRVQGTEYGIGCWYIAADTVMLPNTAGVKTVYACPRFTRPTKDTTYIQTGWDEAGTIPASKRGAASNWYPGDITVGTNCAVLGRNEVANDQRGWKDYCYAGDAYATWREYLVGGRLGNGSRAGSAYVNCTDGVGAAVWYFAGRD